MKRTINCRVVHTVFGVVGNKVVLDGKHVGVNNGGVLQEEPHVIAEFTQLLVELLRSLVDAYQAAMLVVITLLPHCHSWQAAQGTSAVNPELPGAVVVQNLKHCKEMLLCHCAMQFVKLTISRNVLCV
jgi:hypothetical protein